MATKADDLYDLCEETIKDYGERDTMLDSLETYYFLDTGKKDQDASWEEEHEKVVQPHGTNVVDMVMDLTARAGYKITVPAPSEGKQDRDLADECELFLRSAITESERDQRLNMIGRMAWWAAMRGCLGGRVMPVASRISQEEGAEGEGTVYAMGSKLPLQLQPRDPRYLYPEFSTDGLSYVVERWDRKVRDIRDSLGKNVLPDRKATDIVTWTEYWDEEKFCYWAAGDVVSLPNHRGNGPWMHRFGGHIYSFEFARQAGVADPERRVRPLLESMRTIIDRMDLLDSMTMTFISRYIGDSLVVNSDDMAMDGASRDRVTTESGGISFLRTDEVMGWLNSNRQPLEIEGFRGNLQSTFERGTFPGTLYGEDPGRVMAGYAINMLNQSGQARVFSVVSCIERTMESMLSNALMLSEKWLIPYLGKKEISFYTYGDVEDEEEGTQRKVRESHTLKADRLKGYYHVDVQLGELLESDEQSNIVLAEKARQPDQSGRPLLSDETIVEKYKLVEQAGMERERIDRQMAWNQPEVQALNQRIWQAKVIEELKDELLSMGIDPAEVLSEAKQQQQQAQGPAQQGQVPPGLMPPQMQPQVPPEILQALQQQAMMQQMQGMQMPPGVPPGVMPPQMQGQMMPQPGMQVPGEEEMLPPMTPPAPPY